MNRTGLLFACALVAAVAAGQSALPGITVDVVDAMGSSIPNASVKVRLTSTGHEQVCRTELQGSCTFTDFPRGVTVITAEAPGFGKASKHVDLRSSETVRITLDPEVLTQQIAVSTELLPTEERVAQTPGSVQIIDAAVLTQSRVFTFDEALRKAPGLYTRPEEGFGMRPNIGIRGLNPTRSSKVLLLEDGVPLTYAPYGDNASYYHPPVDRFNTIEVIKGSGQIAYGPSTVGGVINYTTPQPPEQASGFLTLTGGNRDYFNGHLRYGGTFRGTGLLFDYMRKQGEGARENTRSGMNDATVKVFRALAPTHTLSVKANYFGEDSNLTYSGLRQSEFEQNPRGNPFLNDFVDFNRYGLSAMHGWAITPSTILTTNVYGQMFFRDWWRQSSNSAQRPNDAGDPQCGGMANLYTTCGNEGRLRRYHVWGIDPRVRTVHSLFGLQNETDFGFRAHYEIQDRRQENGPLPTSRAGILAESNERKNQAYSGFIQNRFTIGKFGITPGIRIEHVEYQRLNRLLNVRGNTDLTQLVPGVALTYTPVQAITVFTGIHRGFAPPRTEDVINNTTGGVVELDPELSWNYELGVRARLARTTSLEATYFRMDFQNQVVQASIAGGTGAALTNGGQTLHEGVEIAGSWDKRSLFGSRNGLSLRTAYTYVPVARFTGTRFSGIGGFTNVRVTGNRVPYAPTYLMTNSITYLHASGFNALLEAVSTGRQYADDLNTINGTPDGQRGRIPGNTYWNATVNYPVEAIRTTFYATTKNAFDRLFIVDRSRGILPGSPRLVQAGVRYTF